MKQATEQLMTTSFLLPPELNTEARIKAAQLRISRGELFRRAVVEYLERHNGLKRQEAADVSTG